MPIAHVVAMSPVRDLNVREVFDYSSLDAETSEFLQQQTKNIKILAQRTVQDIYDIGQILLMVKERLGYGNFLNWLETEIGWEERMAQRFMNVPKNLREHLESETVKLSDLTNIAVTALYYVTAPSTPKQAQAEVFARAQAGEKITYTKITQIKQKYSSPKTKPKPKAEPLPQLELELEAQPLPEPKLQPQPQLQQPPSVPLALKPTKESRIVSIIPQRVAQAIEPEPNQVVSTAPTGQVVASVQRKEGNWWRFDGKHLLYCGDPHDLIFLEKIPDRIPLLIGFPLLPGAGQQSPYLADTYFSTNWRYPDKNESHQEQTIKYSYELFETYILACSKMNDIVVSCFVPSPEILTLISNTKRLGILVEPDEKRCKAIVNDWKGAGSKVEQIK